MKNISPYPYQKEALNKLQNQRSNDRGHGLIVMPPGSGKTVTSALDVLQSDTEKVLFVAPQIEILEQARKEFQKIMPEKSSSLLTSRNENFSDDIIFASPNKLYREEVLNKFHRDDFDYIIYDEAHHLKNNYYEKINDFFNSEFTLGMTATPFLRNVDKEDILKEMMLEETTFEYNLDEAIENDDLVPFKAHVLMDVTDFDDNPVEMNDSELDSKIFYEGRNEMIYRQWKEHSEDRKTIAFCRNVNHSEIIANHFQEKGVEASAVHSEMSDKRRVNRIKNFRKGEIDVLVGVDMFNEGVDFPEVRSLLFLRPTSSKRIFLQQLGRGLRPNSGKDECLVLDFVNKFRWQRFSFYNSFDQSNDVYTHGKCVECGRYSTTLLNTDDGEICKECREEDIEIVKGESDIFVEAEAYFEIVEQYQAYRFGQDGIPEEIILTDLKRCAESIDSRLTMEIYDKIGRFSASIIQQKFNGFTVACQKAGVDTVIEKAEIGEEEFLTDAERVFNEKRKMTQKAYREEGVYSVSPAKTLFGSWSGMKNALDNFSQDYEVSQDEVLREVRRLHQEHGEITDEVLEDNGRYDLDIFRRYSKNTDEIVRKAGVKDKHLLEDVAWVMDFVDDKKLTIGEYGEHGRYAKEKVRKRFGSWPVVRNKAKDLLHSS